MTARFLCIACPLILQLLVSQLQADVLFTTHPGTHQQNLDNHNLTQTIVLFNQQSSGQTGNIVSGHLNGQSPGLVDVQAVAGVTLFADGGQAPQVGEQNGAKLFELSITPNATNDPSQSLFAALSFTIHNENNITDTLTYEVSTVDDDGNPGSFITAARNGNDFFGVVATGPLLSAVKVTSNSGFDALRHLRVSLADFASLPPPPTTATPEPNSLLLLAVAAMVAFVARRRFVFARAK